MIWNVQSLSWRHQAVRSAQTPDSDTQLIQYGRQLLQEAQATQDPGSRNYAWQAKDWTTVALGLLGDLDDADISEWLSCQKKALTDVSNPSDTHEQQHIQSFCWWYLMVAYTYVTSGELLSANGRTIRLTSHSPVNRLKAGSVLAEVDKALHSISSQWSCSGE